MAMATDYLTGEVERSEKCAIFFGLKDICISYILIKRIFAGYAITVYSHKGL
jgi:hypothetical protein